MSPAGQGPVAAPKRRTQRLPGRNSSDRRWKVPALHGTATAAEPTAVRGLGILNSAGEEQPVFFRRGDSSGDSAMRLRAHLVSRRQ